MPNKGNAGIPQQKGKTARPNLYYQRKGTGWTGAMFHAGLMGDLKPDKPRYNTHLGSNLCIFSQTTRCSYTNSWPLEKQCIQKVHQTSPQ